MAGFALLMKARADDRTLLSDPPALNVMSLTDSGAWDAGAMADALMPTGRVELLPPTDLLPETLAQPSLSVSAEERGVRAAIAAIVALFDGAKTFGSLITVPDAVMESLPVLEAQLTGPVSGDLLRREAQIEARERLALLVARAKVLGQQYDCVVANPPYMGGKGMNSRLKALVSRAYPNGKANLFAAFMERCSRLSSSEGIVSMIVMQAWMFLSSYEKFRVSLSNSATFLSLAHLGAGAFDSIGGEVVSTAAFTMRRRAQPAFNGVFFRLVGGQSESAKRDDFLRATSGIAPMLRFTASATAFAKIPGQPLAYWASETIRALFQDHPSLSDAVSTREGLTTGSNDTFLRQWFEVDVERVSFDSESDVAAAQTGRRWFPYVKGGDSRKWYGNLEYLVNWESNGLLMKQFTDVETGRIRSHNYNGDYAFRPGYSWSGISGDGFSVREVPPGFMFDAKGPMGFPRDLSDTFNQIAFLNSVIANHILEMLAPTLDFKIGHILNLPLLTDLSPEVGATARRCIAISSDDWNSFETAWDFARLPLLADDHGSDELESDWLGLRASWGARTEEMRKLEVANNRLLIGAYGLSDELSADVPLSQITLACNPHYRYGGDLTDAERESRLLSDTMRELVSYGVGLMMGRYSLAETGLIHARAGNEGFDPGRYGALPADEDGIVPITEEPWFSDDAATRIEQFLAIAWPKAPINETLATLTDGLTQGKGGEPRAALRAYLAKTFYKDHLQTYRNRPIYWMFSSGKQKAFECLVYLHRYNESTLARMRTAYVTPLMGKMQQRITDLEAEMAASASSAEKARKARERENLVKQLAELRTFDEELRHLADQRIKLDLDDGVKVNYGRFGNLLAAKDKVCGKDDKED